MYLLNSTILPLFGNTNPDDLGRDRIFHFFLPLKKKNQFLFLSSLLNLALPVAVPQEYEMLKTVVLGKQRREGRAIRDTGKLDRYPSHLQPLPLPQAPAHRS